MIGCYFVVVQMHVRVIHILCNDRYDKDYTQACTFQTGMAQKWEASAMSSADGETIPFVGPTALEGPVEAWLCDIEKNMRLTLKEQLKNTRTNLKRMLNKRDKWIKEHFGQVSELFCYILDFTRRFGSLLIAYKNYSL